MDNDIKKMIEKYRMDLMNFNNNHPQRHFNEAPRERTVVGSGSTPQSSGDTTAPQQPRPDQVQPRPDQVQPRPELQPEMPMPPVTMPEIDRPTQPAPEMPLQPMVTPQQPPIEKPKQMQMPTESDILGYIQVRTFTASQATPVANADVVISKGDTILYQLRTNENGATGVVALPTVSKELSQQSGNPRPYETYDIRIKAPGYLNVISKDVPVFEGITGVQNVAMLPLPEFSTNMETEYFNTEPNL